MRSFAPAILLSTCLVACGSTSNRGGELLVDQGLRSALTGDFHGFWTGAASGTVLKSRTGSLLEVPIVLEADLDSDIHWDMDATDVGEVLLEGAGHYNSSVWFVATQIEVKGPRVYITKYEENYEDTLCLELMSVESNGSMRFQAHSFLADPGQGERDACLRGAVRYDATLLLHRGVSTAPEFVESGRNEAPGPRRFGAEPPGGPGSAPAEDDDSNGGGEL